MEKLKIIGRKVFENYALIFWRHFPLLNIFFDKRDTLQKFSTVIHIGFHI